MFIEGFVVLVFKVIFKKQSIKTLRIHKDLNRRVSSFRMWKYASNFLAKQKSKTNKF